MNLPPRDNLSKSITIRVTEETFQNAVMLATADHRRLSDWVRLRVEQAIQRELGEADKPGKKRP